MRDHLDDLESDLSRFHRVDDLHALDGPKFLRLAWRIAAYDGVMMARIQALRDPPDDTPSPTRRTAEPAAPTPRRPSSSSSQRPVVGTLPTGATVVPVAALSLQIPGLIDHVRVS